MDSCNKALYLKNLIWREMYDFSPGCVLMVLADNYYAEDDYIRNYQEFINQVTLSKNSIYIT
jgi:hypothetical protein